MPTKPCSCHRLQPLLCPGPAMRLITVRAHSSAKSFLQVGHGFCEGDYVERSLSGFAL